MENLKMLTYEAIPCWYELSFRGKNGVPGLLLRIHTDFARAVPVMPRKIPGVVDLMKQFEFKSFSGKFGENIGFEECLVYLGTEDEFVEYEIPIPRVKKFKAEPCKHCNGEGYDEEADGKCLWCENGREAYYDYTEAWAIMATLMLFFEFMRFPKRETTAKIPQLMTVQLIILKEMHGSLLGGEYSRELVAYLHSRPSGTISEMIAAMRAVMERMEGGIKSIYEHFGFQAYTQGNDGWLNVSCPGDGCILYPANCVLKGENRGYEFSCKNVDQPIQLLMLLASLAALHDLARVANS